MSMLNFQGSLTCLERGYTIHQNCHSDQKHDAILSNSAFSDKPHFWGWFSYCSARLWSCCHNVLENEGMILVDCRWPPTYMILRSMLCNYFRIWCYSIEKLQIEKLQSFQKFLAPGSQTSNQRRSDVRLRLCLKLWRLWTGCWIVPGYKTLWAVGRVEIAFWWEHEL